MDGSPRGVATRAFAVASVVIAVVLLVASPVDRASGADWDAVAPVNQALFDDPQFLANLRAGGRADATETAKRGSAERRAERRSSRSAFSRVSRAEARQLAQRTFPELMVGDLDPLALPGGLSVKGFRAENVAQVVNAAGDGSLVVGSQPFAARDAAGKLAAVDLSLRTDGSSFEPRRAQADVTIPRRSDGYLEVGDDAVRIRPVAAAAVDGEVSDGRVFYGDIALDTDYVTMPTALGAQVMWQLRSARSPQELPLELALPTGATARLTSSITAPVGNAPSAAGSGIEIVEAGTVIETITPPLAMDADGVPVPVSYRLDGATLIVEIPHQAMDAKYPIAVDPIVQEVWGGGDLAGTCGNGYGNLRYFERLTPFGHYCNNGWWGGPGLYVESSASMYFDGATGFYQFGTPARVHIISAWLDGVYHQAAGTHVYAGIAGPYAWEALAPDNAGDEWNGQRTLVASPGNDTNAVVFGLWMDGAWTRPHYGLAAMHGANIRLGDYYAPYDVKLDWISTGLPYTWANNQASPWISGATNVTARVVASDLGLGIYHLGIDPQGGGDYVSHQVNNCNGNRSGPCPAGLPATGTLNFGQRKGLVTLRTFASDITDNLSHGPQWVMRVDRDNPLITLSGEVIDHKDDNTLGPGAELVVDVKDGSASSASSYQSGVRRVTVTIDGVEQRWTNQNSDATNNDYRWTHRLPVGTNGTHTVHVEAVDDVGQRGTKDLVFVSRPYPMSWRFGGANGTVDTQDEVESLFAAIHAESDAEAILAGLSPTDAALVNSQLAPAPSDAEDPGEGDLTVWLPNSGAAGAHEFNCFFGGVPFGAVRRPYPPSLTATIPDVRIVARGDFRCDGDHPVSVQMKVRLEKWFPNNQGKIGWQTIAKDDETFTGTLSTWKTKTIGRDCTGGNSYRTYRTRVELAVINPVAVNPREASTRSSPSVKLPCRAG